MNGNIWKVWRLTVSLKEAWLWQRQAYCQPFPVAKNLNKVSLSMKEWSIFDICWLGCFLCDIVRDYQTRCAVPPRTKQWLRSTNHSLNENLNSSLLLGWDKAESYSLNTKVWFNKIIFWCYTYSVFHSFSALKWDQASSPTIFFCFFCDDVQCKIFP